MLHRCLEEESFLNKGTFCLNDHSPFWGGGGGHKAVANNTPVLSMAVCHANLALAVRSAEVSRVKLLID